MEINAIPIENLTADQVSAWSCLQQADPALDSPFFRPEFAQAVSAAGRSVEVGVLEEEKEPVGFLPFVRTVTNVGKPVGTPMSDFQGPILRRDVECSPERLIAGMGLVAWRFDHLVVAQEGFDPPLSVVAPSPYMDLSHGFEAYCDRRRKLGSRSVKQLLRKGRKLAREVGPLRVVPHDASPEAFEALVTWKTAQCRRTGVACALDIEWIRTLMQSSIDLTDEAYCGMLWTLYAGDRLAAVDLTIRSFGVLHSWIPAYDTELGSYSPGSVLLLEMAKLGAEMGIERIDLGKGEQAYKSSFASGAFDVAEGTIDSRPLIGTLWRRWYCVRNWIRCSRFRAPAHRVDRVLSIARRGLGAGE